MILENYRERSHITNIRKHVSFYFSMPLKRARRVSKLKPEKSTSLDSQNQVSEEVKPNAMQGKKKIQKAAIANRFSNVPRNLRPGVGRSYVDSKRNKRFELLGSIVKILNSVPFSVIYLEHQLCACQRHFEMLY